MKKPNPGSEEAIKAGCTCPVLDNGHGKGYQGMKNIFVYNLKCPIHKPPKKMKSDKARKSNSNISSIKTLVEESNRRIQGK